MNHYEKLIAEATGLTDIERIRMVENYMRHIYFHSTLNWQTEKQLVKAARDSVGDLNVIGWDFR